MSPCGGDGIVSFGIRGRGPLGMAFSCISESITIATGPIGGVIIIRYARIEEFAIAARDAGLSSHFVKSRIIAAMSCALWYQFTPGGRTPASMWLPITRKIGTRSAYALKM